MTRASLLAICSADGRVLLMRRTDDAPRYPGHWALFGGHAEDDENAFDCVLREAQEELAIDARPVELLGKVMDASLPAEVTIFATPMKWTLENLRAQQAEGDGCDLFTVEQARELPMPEHCREALELARARGWVQ